MKKQGVLIYDDELVEWTFASDRWITTAAFTAENG